MLMRVLRRPLARQTIAAIAAACLVPGCYRYIPETGVEPAVGLEYRGHLSSVGVERMQPYMGRDVTTFAGRVLAASDTAFEFAMATTVTLADPRPVVWSGERIWVPRGSIERIERKELDRRRTVRSALLIGVGTLAALSLWLGIKGKVSGDPGGGNPTIPF